MARHPFTSSERKGIMAVAGIALAVIGLGLIVGVCGRTEDALVVPEVEILLPEDSVGHGAHEKNNKEKSDSLKKRKKKTKSPRMPKTYRQRNPLDEPAKF